MPKREFDPTPFEQVILEARYLRGETIAQLARDCAVSAQTLRCRLREWGIYAPRQAHPPPKPLRDGELYCRTCESWVLLDDFPRDSRRPHGRYSECKACYGKRWESRYYPKRVERLYGLDRADYLALLAAQEYACAVCGEVKRLVVDHDHATGSVRGLLCARCNRTLGQWNDDPCLIAKALRYLLSSRKDSKP